MAAIEKIKTRDKVEEKYKWKVDKMYATDGKWEEDFKKLKENTSSLLEFKGKLSDGVELLNYLCKYEELASLYEDLVVYAHLRSDEDKSNSKYQVMMDKISTFGAEFSGIISFFLPELLSMEVEDVKKLIENTEGLKHYEIYITNIFEGKPHILSEAEENILANVSDCLSAPSNIFTMLTNADMTFPKIKDEEGNEVELTASNYSIFIASKDRKVREEAFKALFNTYKKFENTISTSYTASVKNFIFESKIRKYDSCLEASLKPNKIPVEVYKNVVGTVNKRIDSLHRYVELKKKLLNLDEIHMYDLYVPMVSREERKYTFEEAKAMVLEGLKPLGEDYLSLLREGFTNRWIDVYENEGKRSGAYSWGVYGIHPYVLLNFNGTLDSVFTLAHEMGHALHSWFSDKNQTYIDAGYKIFVAEVASTCNEALLIRHLLETTSDKKERAYLVNHFMDSFRGTLYRQAMFAEFEAETHRRAGEGEVLTAEVLCKIYHRLNEEYFGPDMVVDQEIDYEWSRIPHFYTSFYVYQYATGFSAAIAISSRILKGDENAVKGYFEFLSGGNSMTPIDLLKLCGVDMGTAEPVKDALQVFAGLLEEMSQLI